MATSHGAWEGDVRALLASNLVTPTTRRSLDERIARPVVVHSRFFTPATFLTLQAVCARLLPQPERIEPIDLAGPIDARLASGEGDGWRYDVLPVDGDAYRAGLDDIDRQALHEGGTSFHALEEAAQDRILRSVQRGESLSGSPAASRRFFEDLLAEISEIYYSHPIAHQEIGYVGMADTPGWQAIGLDQREAREPRRSGGDCG